MSLFRIPVEDELGCTAFGFYTSEDIKKISVKRLTEPISLDILGNATKDGLYDPALGPLERFSTCQTCSLSERDCPGHLGHIELCVPVYNPILFRHMLRLLKTKCFKCHSLRISKQRTEKFLKKLILLEEGKIFDTLQVDQAYVHVDWCKKEQEESAKLKADPSYEQSLLEKQTKTGTPVLDNIRHHEEYLAQAIAAFARDQAKFKQKLNIDTPTEKVEAIFKPKNMAVEELRERLLHDFLTKVPKICENCQARSPVLRNDPQCTKIFKTMSAAAKKFNRLKRVFVEAKDLDATNNEEVKEGGDTETGAKQTTDAVPVTKQKYMAPTEVRKHLRLLFNNNKRAMDLIWGSIKLDNGMGIKKADPDVFFLDVIAVTATRFRPLNRMGDRTMEHPQNVHLSKILTVNKELLALGATDNAETADSELLDKQINKWTQLQLAVNALFDNEPAPGQSKAPPGVKQLLEKKEGLFRKHMMGKRVNYAARSVISPDPFLETNEIGIPLHFALRLTYPEPVTEVNFMELSKAVINGPKKHPGANAVLDELGNLTFLKPDDPDSRLAISRTLRTVTQGKGSSGVKKVYRHIRTGDVVLVNRQPSLHKPSMMAHKVRVLSTEKTIRMHYANCNTYNADFDGDEMNIHFPQNELARAEAYGIALNDNQYVVPRSGAPLRGLIQDHVVMGVLLTLKDTFLTKEEFQHLVYAACAKFSHRRGKEKSILTVPPCILKPQQLWSGKQVITNVLNELLSSEHYPISLDGKSKVPGDIWGPSHSLEGKVIIRHNELLTGLLDKNQFGASAFGLVHGVYELYGPTKAGELLSSLGRLFTAYLHMVGFTCGIDDLLLTNEADQVRMSMFGKAAEIGIQAAAQFAGQPVETSREEVRKALKTILTATPEEVPSLDGAMKQKLHPMTSEIISNCIPKGQIKKFPANNLTMMTTSGAKGSIVNASQISCLLGQMELEGARVAYMASGKTLPCFDPYDPSPRAGGYIVDRFLTGVRPQEFYFHCMAGREGLVDTAVKTSRSGYLQRCLIKHLESLRVHYDGTVRDSDSSVVQFNYGEDSIDVSKTQFLDKFPFLSLNSQHLAMRHFLPTALKVLDSRKPRKYLRQREADPFLKETTTIQSECPPQLHLGAVSESFHEKLTKYIEANPDGNLKATNPYEKSKDANDKIRAAKWALFNGKRKRARASHFRKLMQFYYNRCMVEPGEAVGLLAAQSIGEPSTQMTLNTFHNAGRGEANVTLGIPRLREIIMTASRHIKTPSMLLPIISGKEKHAIRLSERLYRLCLMELISRITVTDTVVTDLGGRWRVYNIALQLKPKDEWVADQSFWSLCASIEDRFIPQLLATVRKELQMRKSPPAVGVEKQEDAPADEGDEEEGPAVRKRKNNATKAEEGALEEKRHNKRREQASYDDAEEEEVEMITEIEKEKKRAAKEERKAEETQLHRTEEAELSEAAQDNEVAGPKPIQEATPKQFRNKKLLGSDELLRDYEFDAKMLNITLAVQTRADEKKILMTSLLERLTSNFTLSAVPGITRCYIRKGGKNDSFQYAVQTEGVNLRAIWTQTDLVDVNRLTCNSVGDVLETYGVEAARSVIASEIAAVFAVYGIDVDYRHLALIADYMTAGGDYRPFNRTGMAASSSPLQKMSFETSHGFLTHAAANGDYDTLQSPSARLVMGQVVMGGTGGFELLQPLSGYPPQEAKVTLEEVVL